MKEWKKKKIYNIGGKKTVGGWNFFFLCFFFLSFFFPYHFRYSQIKMALGLGGNGVINVGHLVAFVTLTGRVTGAESGSKCAHSA